MQAIWKGTISFGLVTIPIKVYSATEERNISFRQVHEADGGRIRTSGCARSTARRCRTPTSGKRMSCRTAASSS